MKLNFNNLFLNISWIWPWFIFLDLCKNYKKYYINVNDSAKIILLSILLPTILINNNAIYSINLMFLIAILLIKRKSLETKNYRDISFFTLIYFSAGGIYALYLFITTNVERVGFFNSEINFSSFYVLLFFMFCRENKYLRNWSLLFVFFNLIISGSRTFLFLFLIYILLSYLIDKLPKFLLHLFLLVSVILITNLEYLLDLILLIFDQEKSGYVSDYKRLLVFYDSSSQVRIDVNNSWLTKWFENLKSFFWGVSNYSTELKYIGYNPHNSFIQKGAEFGSVYIFLVYYFVLSKVRLNVGITFLIYGLFLHNLYSVPIMYMLYIFFPKRST